MKKERSHSKACSTPKGFRAVQDKFFEQVNMTPESIRRWSKDPRAVCASFKETVARLTKPQMWKGKMRRSLASLKSLDKRKWTLNDCEYAERVNSFNSRHIGALKQHGCTVPEVVALRNWGHNPRCPEPPMSCKPKKDR